MIISCPVVNFNVFVCFMRCLEVLTVLAKLWTSDIWMGSMIYSPEWMTLFIFGKEHSLRDVWKINWVARILLIFFVVQKSIVFGSLNGLYSTAVPFCFWKKNSVMFERLNANASFIVSRFICTSNSVLQYVVPCICVSPLPFCISRMVLLFVVLV